jgi:hypothetical protein
MLKIALLLLLPGQILAQEKSWLQNYLEKEFLTPALIKASFPHSEYLDDFQLSTSLPVDRKLPIPSRIAPVKINCEEKVLWPAHPQEGTKEILYAANANYRHKSLPPKSPACLEHDTNQRYCLKATVANVVVLSDTYQDECGNFYRGYWVATFRKTEERLETLASRGRAVSSKPNAKFREEVIFGDTSPVIEREFLFLTPLWYEDESRIERLRKEALEGPYRLSGQKFIRR